MNPADFAQRYFATGCSPSASEQRLREAIKKGKVKPEMSLRQIAEVVGIKNAETVRYYLKKFIRGGNK